LSELSPVIFFTYNRLSHCLRTLESLKRVDLADKSDLIIFSDGPKDDEDLPKVQEVRQVLRNLDGFASITLIEREVNYGLKRSIIEGISTVLAESGKAIIVEDDLEFSSGFLKYLNKALDFYEKYDEVQSVAGYSYPVKIPDNYRYDSYFFHRCSTWGWGTWKDRWEKADWEVKDFNKFSRNLRKIMAFNRGGDDLFEMLRLQMDGVIDTWDIQWCYAHYSNSGFCVYPITSFVHNTGCDGSGVHKVKTRSYDVELQNMDMSDIKFCTPDSINSDIIRLIQNYFSYPLPKRLRKYFKLYFLRKYCSRFR